MPETSPREIDVPDPLVAPLRDAAYLVRRIAAVSGSDPKQVASSLAREHRDLGSTVAAEIKQRGIERYTWSDELVEFYRDTDAFLYETLIWNRSPSKNVMRRWIAERLAEQFDRPQRILTFGDGLGFDSLYLAQAGHEVTYFDVSDEGGSFATELFADFDASVTMLKSASDLLPESYDIVVCLDVLEHVPDPPQVVKMLADAIRPGGLMFVHAPFWYIAPSVATHLRSNKKYSGDFRRLYQPNGLSPVDGEFFWNPLLLAKTDPKSGTTKTRLPLSKRFGGLLLRTARFACWPHVMVTRMIFRKEWKPWPEIDELC